MGLWKELNLAHCNWYLTEFIYCNQTLNEGRWMTSHSSDHRPTVIHLEKKPFVDLKWNTEELFCSVSWWKDLDSGLQKGTPEFIIWITEFGWYTWRERSQEEGVRFFLFWMRWNSLDMSEGKTQHAYEWTCLTMTTWLWDFSHWKVHEWDLAYQEREKKYYLKIQTNSTLLSKKMVQILCFSEAVLFIRKANKVGTNHQ